MTKNRFLLITPILCLCFIAVCFNGCARKQAPAVIDLQNVPTKPPRPIVKSPRQASYYEDEFILTVFNVLAHQVVVMMIGEEPIIIEAGQRADVSFKKGHDCRKVILTANVQPRGGKMIGTAERKQCIPSLKRRSRTADIWIIDDYRPLKR